MLLFGDGRVSRRLALRKEEPSCHDLHYESFFCLALATALWVAPILAQTTGIRERVVAHHFELVPPGEGPFSTIIAIPGCSGIAFADPAAEAGHADLQEDDRLFRRHYPEMAERLRAEGFAVLLIDVHAAEGLVTACAGEIAAERIAAYIDESVAWARELDLVDPTRLHVMGWSMGGLGCVGLAPRRR